MYCSSQLFCFCCQGCLGDWFLLQVWIISMLPNNPEDQVLYMSTTYNLLCYTIHWLNTKKLSAYKFLFHFSPLCHSVFALLQTHTFSQSRLAVIWFTLWSLTLAWLSWMDSWSCCCFNWFISNITPLDLSFCLCVCLCVFIALSNLIDNQEVLTFPLLLWFKNVQIYYVYYSLCMSVKLN